MKTVSSPHDRLFKTALSDVRVAKEFFEQYLPDDIKQSLNLEKLKLCPKSFIDKDLQFSESDILYKTQIGNKTAFLYLLAEHQSSPDKLMPFRVIKYMAGIWTDYLKQNKEKKLPLIYPLVFYHGKEPYTDSKDIKDLISAPRALIDTILFKPFQLINTQELNDDELKNLHGMGAMAFFMKHIYDPDFLPSLNEIMYTLKTLEKNDYTELVITLLNYVLNSAQNLNVKKFTQTVKEKLSEVTGDNIMTGAEQLIQEGLQRGLYQGKLEGFLQCGHEVLLRLLKRKFGPVPTHYRQLTEHANEIQIVEWSENLIDAKTIDEVFQ
jgi:predicted transposase/invertase (TIGR01784 family)